MQPELHSSLIVWS